MRPHRVLLALLLAAGPLWADDKPALPLPLSGFEASGPFHLYRAEERLVTIEFAWKKDGSFDNKSALALAGQTARTSFTVTPDKDGRWEKITATNAGTESTIVRKGDVAEVTTKGKTETVK